MFIYCLIFIKNKAFLKNISKTVTSSMLTYFRTELRDPTYTISKIYGFKASKIISCNVQLEDFTYPDFNIEVEFKGQTSPDTLKIFFEVSSIIDKTETEIIAPTGLKTMLKGQTDHFKELSKKVDLKPLTNALIYMICKM